MSECYYKLLFIQFCFWMSFQRLKKFVLEFNVSRWESETVWNRSEMWMCYVEMSEICYEHMDHEVKNAKVRKSLSLKSRTTALTTKLYHSMNFTVHTNDFILFTSFVDVIVYDIQSQDHNWSALSPWKP